MSPSSLVTDLVPVPTEGRTFTAHRKVRLADVSPNGRMRLDAVARFVQDVSNDDTVDAGLQDDMAWVVRRTVIEVYAEARLREDLALTTFCGGTGSRWAERRVSIRGERGAHIESATIWVHLDMKTGRPLRLPAQFHEIYDEAAGGRTVRARLTHEAPPGSDDAADGEVSREPWPLRFSDFDVMDHVNNAVAWMALEQARVDHKHLRAPVRAEVEYRDAIERHDRVEQVVLTQTDGSLSTWLVDASSREPDTAERIFTSARVVPL